MANVWAVIKKAELLVGNIVTHQLAGEAPTLTLRRKLPAGTFETIATVKGFERQRIADTSTASGVALSFADVFAIPAQALTVAQSDLIAVIEHDGYRYDVQNIARPAGQSQDYKFKITNRKKV